MSNSTDVPAYEVHLHDVTMAELKVIKQAQARQFKHLAIIVGVCTTFLFVMLGFAIHSNHQEDKRHFEQIISVLANRSGLACDKGDVLDVVHATCLIGGDGTNAVHAKLLVFNNQDPYRPLTESECLAVGGFYNSTNGRCAMPGGL